MPTGMIKLATSPLLFVLTLVTVLLPQSANADQVDTFIQTVMQQRHIPGLQLAIVKDGKLVKRASYGKSNLQDQIAVTNETVFPINSMTKAFAGVALMQLVESGELTIEDPIGQHLPDLPAHWQKIKIKHLMAHTSGLPAILSGYFVDLLVRGDPDASWQEVQTRPMQSTINTRFQYNQTGYVIIGKILDKYRTEGFPKFIREHQLKPVGMTLTDHAGFDYLEYVVPNQARQYMYLPNRKQYRNFYGEFSYIMRTAAGMSSTATELAQYLIALESGKLIKDVTGLWQPVRLENGNTAGFNSRENGYAMGWQVIGRDQHPAISASGGDATTMITYPNDKVSVVVLTNLLGGLPTQFVDDIAEFYFDER